MAEVPDLLQAALGAMITRGKGQLGEPVLDSPDDAETAMRGKADVELMGVAVIAARDTVETCKGRPHDKGRPHELGRARLSGDRSVGLVEGLGA